MLGVLGRFGGRALHMATQIVLARLLGPLQFGLYAIGWSVLRFLGIVPVLGLDFGAIYIGSRYVEKRRGEAARSVALAVGLSRDELRDSLAALPDDLPVRGLDSILGREPIGGARFDDLWAFLQEA